MNRTRNSTRNGTNTILVVGSLNMDLVTAVKTHPKPGDTMLGGDVATFPGGKGANQAAAAAKAGGHVVMLGCVGDDAFGKTLRNALEHTGVDVCRVERVPGSSGMAFITVAEGGQNMIVVSPGANGKLTPDRLPDDLDSLLGGVALVMMQLEVPLETVATVARRAHTQGVPVLLNPAPAQRLEDTLLETLTYLVVNEGEAAVLSGGGVEDTLSAQQAAEALRKRGANTVMVTLGANGVVWSSPENDGHLLAHKVDVVDTTATGDAFCGALATRLAEGAGLEAALRFANAAGALTATKEGAQPSLPTRDDITAWLATQG